MTSTDNNNQTNNGDQEKALETVYDLFEKFIKETIIDGKSFFDDTISVKGVIDDLVDAYIVNGLSNAQYKTKREEEHYKELEGFGLFHNKSLLQIKTLYKKGETYERKALEHLFASMLWLRYLPVGDVKTENKKKIIQKWVNDSSDKIYFPEKTLALYGMAQQQIDADMVHLIALFHFLFSTNFSDHFLKKNGSYVYFNILTNSNLENITKKNLSLNIEIYSEIIKKEIIQWILDENSIRTNFYAKELKVKNGWEKRIDIKKQVPVYNMLLNLCDKNNYEPIAVQRHKESIVKYLYPEFCGKEKWDNIKENYMNLGDIDSYLAKIKKEIINNDKKNKTDKLWGEKGFWSEGLIEKWRGEYVANAYEILNTYQKQIILYGAPGTGKTYNAKKIINEFLNNVDNASEFLTRLRIDGENEFNLNKIKFSEFEEITPRSKKLKFNPRVKGFIDTPIVWEIVQFNQSFSYEDFIEGLRPAYNGDIDIVDGVFKKFVKAAEGHKDKKFIFIIDEINRGKIDKIFGELLYLLEYRDESLRLHYSGDDFSIPENVYIIGTMNTADKSLALLDVALRRRFWFVRCEPLIKVLKDGFNIDDWNKLTNEDTGDNIKRIAINLFELLNGKNNTGGILEKLGDDAQELKIGHSYFLKLIKNSEEEPSFSDLKNIWFYSIIPLLEEYCGFNKRLLSDLFTGNQDLSKKENFTLNNLKKI